jgi:predicted AlkP superfamily phosphohydrolase/phosphomutase
MDINQISQALCVRQNQIIEVSVMRKEKGSESDIVLTELKGADLRQQFVDSHFLDEEYDGAIIGIHKSGAIVYNYFDLLFMMMDSRQDKFPGENYEKQKAEFSQEFQDFYDMVDDQLCGLKNEFESLQEKSNTIYPLILPAVRLTTADGTIMKIFNHKNI